MTLSHSNNIILAGDIGGTKTSLAVFQREQGFLKPLAENTINNDTASSLEAIIKDFLQKSEIQPEAACFGIAGPVNHNRVRMTNYDWFLDGRALREELNMRSVLLINDLVATAMGAVNLSAADLLTLNNGNPDREGAIAVIAPGTGLGESFLVRCRDTWLPVPSEGGHASFAPTDGLQRRLLQSMAKKHDLVSTEMVCSGMGIPVLYAFLCTEEGRTYHLDNESDATRTIVKKAMSAVEKKNFNDLAYQTLRLFAAILAAEAANLVLKTMASGGLYIGGGLPPRILPFLQSDIFMHYFSRGEYREMLSAVPVRVILEPRAALIGAAAYGFEHGPLAEEKE